MENGVTPLMFRQTAAQRRIPGGWSGQRPQLATVFLRSVDPERFSLMADALCRRICAHDRRGREDLSRLDEGLMLASGAQQHHRCIKMRE